MPPDLTAARGEIARSERTAEQFLEQSLAAADAPANRVLDASSAIETALGP